MTDADGGVVAEIRHTGASWWRRDWVVLAVVLAAIAAATALIDRFDLLVHRLDEDAIRTATPMLAAWLMLPIGIAWYARRRLREAWCAITERDLFLESVAHRLRTPLSSVVGYSLLMRDEPSETRVEDLSWMVEEVATRSIEAADLLDDMLVAAHLDHGGLELLLVPIDASDEVEWVLRNYPGDEDLEVVYTGPRRWALGDPVRVRQILRILLGNGRSHGGDSLRIEVDTTDGRIVVGVADNGPGLPAVGEDGVIRPFVTEADPGDPRFPIGLGLNVAGRLAERMGGALTYARRDGWTRFELVLPRAARGEIDLEAPVVLPGFDPEPAAATG